MHQWYILLMFSFSMIMCVHIGSISNTIYMSNISQTFLNLSCFDCKCRALMNSSLGWNCLTLNNSCILIRNYSSNDNGLLPMNNSTFFFQEFPSTLTTTMSTSTSTRSTTSEYLFSFQIYSTYYYDSYFSTIMHISRFC